MCAEHSKNKSMDVNQEVMDREMTLMRYRVCKTNGVM